MLWHEGEQPSRTWGFDKRGRADSTDRRTVSRTINRRRQIRAARGDVERPRARGGPRPKVTLNLSDQELADRYAKGESLNQLAAAAGSNSGTVRRRLLALDVEMRPAGAVSRAAQAGDAPVTGLGITDAELVARYQAGEGLKQLRASLGRSEQTVRQRLIALGVTIRPRGTSPRENR
jgi:hypothetical protein